MPQVALIPTGPSGLAIVFGNIGYTRSFTGSFGDLDNSPDTINPGKVRKNVEANRFEAS